jgi:hypothetical protein
VVVVVCGGVIHPNVTFELCKRTHRLAGCDESFLECKVVVVCLGKSDRVCRCRPWVHGCQSCRVGWHVEREEKWDVSLSKGEPKEDVPFAEAELNGGIRTSLTRTRLLLLLASYAGAMMAFCLPGIKSSSASAASRVCFLPAT